MKRASMLSLLVLVIMALAPLAWAGEVKGPSGPGGAEGGSTPVDGFFAGTGAASICSFSGLNDIIDDAEPTRTQSFGTFMVLVKKSAEVSPAEAKAILGETPADSCNPNRFPLGNPKK